ncbi:PD-(D/E)XK nuclease superfamily protein [Acinetobacter calcoaceticus]|uniref:PD-(D/E)XK nuclease superfamily protein n=1 Tax=Acinetobacter calcoaceticus TaxID=471 RepID=A0A4R1XWI5_ACICA|nr:PD-(D/E)XK nuclease superfamily protein [Acinetobacter calcoaceticus]
MLLDQSLISQYENLLQQAKTLQRPAAEVTIFDSAARKHYENPTTELLSFFLDPNKPHALDRSFYYGLIQSIRENIPAYQDFEFGDFIELCIEQKTSQNSRIDLWLETDTALIVVEAKIHHVQNNPFADYIVWGNAKIEQSLRQSRDMTENANKKVLIPLILCPNGKSQIGGWSGLSYAQLSTQVRKSLAHQMMEQPLSKWGIFARDFLLHLDSYKSAMDIDMDRFKFVHENITQIQALVELREAFYQDIIGHIQLALQCELGEEYEQHLRRHTWPRGPALRFIGNNWKDWSDSALYLHIDQQPLSCSVWMYLQHPTDDAIKFIVEALEQGKHQKDSSGYEGANNEYWFASWEFSHFDLDEVTALICRNHQLLNSIELAKKQNNKQLLQG